MGHNSGGKVPTDELTIGAPMEQKSIPFIQRLTCTIAEACDATGLGRTKLYELIGAGKIATTSVGRRRLVIVRSLQELVDADALEAGRVKRIW